MGNIKKYLLIILVLFGCTRKVVTSSSRSEIVEVNKREIPPVKFNPPDRKELTQIKVFKDDTVIIKYKKIYLKGDTIYYPEYVDCPDAVDTVTTITERETIAEEKTGFGKFVDKIGVSIKTIIVIGFILLGLAVLFLLRKFVI